VVECLPCKCGAKKTPRTVKKKTKNGKKKKTLSIKNLLSDKMILQN
jgi:hypothetical protein